MAQAIGVISGVLGIFSFVQGLFPDRDEPENIFRFRIGVDGAVPPGCGDCGPLSDAGGEIPDVRCFNPVGDFIGITVNDGNTCNSGSEACETSVTSDNACSYTLLTGNNDALCMAWVSIRTPGGDQYGNTIGNWASYCDANFGTGGSWYYSAVQVQLEGGETTDGLDCAWIDGDGDIETTGIQIHWTDFDGSGGATQPDDFYCTNTPALRFRTEPDPSDITFWTQSRLFAKRDEPVAFKSKSILSPVEKQKQRRAANQQHERLSKRFANDTTVVKSKLANHDATRLCTSKMSVGRSFVSYRERQFCDMSVKTLYPFCEDIDSGSCWSDAENALVAKRDVVSFSSNDAAPLLKFTDTVVWE